MREASQFTGQVRSGGENKQVQKKPGDESDFTGSFANIRLLFRSRIIGWSMYSASVVLLLAVELARGIVLDPLLIIALSVGASLFLLNETWIAAVIGTNAVFFLLHGRYFFNPEMPLLVGKPALSFVVVNVFSFSVRSLWLQKRTINRQLEQSQEMLDRFVRSLVRTVDARDPYTADHSYRVALYSFHLGSLLGLSQDKLNSLWLGGLLHDIGKIGIPEPLLLKPGKLGAEEFAVLQHHPVIGHNILEGLPVDEDVRLIARHHHERVDGNGYPDRLNGDAIPLVAKIACLADSFDAMTTRRSYKHPMSLQSACEELTQCSGDQFDPRCVLLWIDSVSSFGGVEQLVVTLQSTYAGRMGLVKDAGGLLQRARQAVFR